MGVGTLEFWEFGFCVDDETTCHFPFFELLTKDARPKISHKIRRLKCSFLVWDGVRMRIREGGDANHGSQELKIELLLLTNESHVHEF